MSTPESRNVRITPRLPRLLCRRDGPALRGGPHRASARAHHWQDVFFAAPTAFYRGEYGGKDLGDFPIGCGVGSLDRLGVFLHSAPLHTFEHQYNYYSGDGSKVARTFSLTGCLPKSSPVLLQTTDQSSWFDTSGGTSKIQLSSKVSSFPERCISAYDVTRVNVLLSWSATFSMRAPFKHIKA